jgi:hypothetical protein
LIAAPASRAEQVSRKPRKSSDKGDDDDVQRQAELARKFHAWRICALMPAQIRLKSERTRDDVVKVQPGLQREETFVRQLLPRPDFRGFLLDSCFRE